MCALISSFDAFAMNFANSSHLCLNGVAKLMKRVLGEFFHLRTLNSDDTRTLGIPTLPPDSSQSPVSKMKGMTSLCSYHCGSSCSHCRSLMTKKPDIKLGITTISSSAQLPNCPLFVSSVPRTSLANWSHATASVLQSCLSAVSRSRLYNIIKLEESSLEDLWIDFNSILKTGKPPMATSAVVLEEHQDLLPTISKTNDALNMATFMINFMQRKWICVHLQKFLRLFVAAEDVKSSDDKATLEKNMIVPSKSLMFDLIARSRTCLQKQWAIKLLALRSTLASKIISDENSDNNDNQKEDSLLDSELIRIERGIDRRGRIDVVIQHLIEEADKRGGLVQKGFVIEGLTQLQEELNQWNEERENSQTISLQRTIEAQKGRIQMLEEQLLRYASNSVSSSPTGGNLTSPTGNVNGEGDAESLQQALSALEIEQLKLTTRQVYSAVERAQQSSFVAGLLAAKENVDDLQNQLASQRAQFAKFRERIQRDMKKELSDVKKSAMAKMLKTAAGPTESKLHYLFGQSLEKSREQIAEKFYDMKTLAHLKTQQLEKRAAQTEEAQSIIIADLQRQLDQQVSIIEKCQLEASLANELQVSLRTAESNVTQFKRDVLRKDLEINTLNKVIARLESENKKGTKDLRKAKEREYRLNEEIVREAGTEAVRRMESPHPQHIRNANRRIVYNDDLQHVINSNNNGNEHNIDRQEDNNQEVVPSMQQEMQTKPASARITFNNENKPVSMSKIQRRLIEVSQRAKKEAKLRAEAQQKTMDLQRQMVKTVNQLFVPPPKMNEISVQYSELSEMSKVTEMNSANLSQILEQRSLTMTNDDPNLSGSIRPKVSIHLENNKPEDRSVITQTQVSFAPSLITPKSVRNRQDAKPQFNMIALNNIDMNSTLNSTSSFKTGSLIANRMPSTPTNPPTPSGSSNNQQEQEQQQQQYSPQSSPRFYEQQYFENSISPTNSTAQSMLASASVVRQDMYYNNNNQETPSTSRSSRETQDSDNAKQSQNKKHVKHHRIIPSSPIATSTRQRPYKQRKGRVLTARPRPSTSMDNQPQQNRSMRPITAYHRANGNNHQEIDTVGLAPYIPLPVNIHDKVKAFGSNRKRFQQRQYSVHDGVNRIGDYIPLKSTKHVPTHFAKRNAQSRASSRVGKRSASRVLRSVSVLANPANHRKFEVRRHETPSLIPQQKAISHIQNDSNPIADSIRNVPRIHENKYFVDSSIITASPSMTARTFVDESRLSETIQ
eukprot:TRINITY_DN4224_c0_g1_i1.p1 TRINITY_DN4224_c0_g1~~TRINITY_DN4224_c0_g1_i1.p1  ORF type:complete len:1285 (-),score=342.54 TRINITY_DN4224_c0_g1_i1:160-3870(-)